MSKYAIWRVNNSVNHPYDVKVLIRYKYKKKTIFTYSDEYYGGFLDYIGSKVIYIYGDNEEHIEKMKSNIKITDKYDYINIYTSGNSVQYGAFWKDEVDITEFEAEDNDSAKLYYELNN